MLTARQLLPLLVLLGACQHDPLESSDQIAGWANSASSLAVFTHGYEPLAFADGEISFEDSGCPATSDDGTTVSIVGNGCGDIDGDVFYGSATVVRTNNGRDLDLDGYGRSRDGGPVGFVTGSFDVTELETDLFAFDVDLVVEGGVDSEIQYSGTVRGSYDGPTLWNGEGAVRREGGAIHDGLVEAVTVDQLRDNEICPGEGISGTTTLVSDEHVIEIRYDGATDCDEQESARWSRDGVDKGLVGGVVCAIGHPGGRAPRGPALALLGLVALALVARRRR